MLFGEFTVQMQNKKITKEKNLHAIVNVPIYRYCRQSDSSVLCKESQTMCKRSLACMMFLGQLRKEKDFNGLHKKYQTINKYILNSFCLVLSQRFQIPMGKSQIVTSHLILHLGKISFGQTKETRIVLPRKTINLILQFHHFPQNCTQQHELQTIAGFVWCTP